MTTYFKVLSASIALAGVSLVLTHPERVQAEASFMSAASPQGQRAFILLEDPELDPETQKLLAEEEKLLEEIGHEPEAAKNKPTSSNDSMILTESAPSAAEEEALIRQELASLRPLKQSPTAEAPPQTVTRGKLLRKPDQIELLKKELEETRNRLLIAETEVARLERILEKKHAVQLEKLTSGAKQQRVALPSNAAPAHSDFPIATVVTADATLRSGPDTKKSELMKMPRGVRLTVETRKGNWYRISTPSGIRGWISSKHVHFGKDALSVPTDTIKISGYDESIE